MAIEITDDQPLRLTREQYERLNQEYQRSFTHYAGDVPSFETWARKKVQESLSEGKQLLAE